MLLTILSKNKFRKLVYWILYYEYCILNIVYCRERSWKVDSSAWNNGGGEGVGPNLPGK